jgi:hypothetical protein
MLIIAIDAISAAKNRTEKDHLEFRAAAAILHGNTSPLQNPRQFLQQEIFLSNPYDKELLCPPVSLASLHLVPRETV